MVERYFLPHNAICQLQKKGCLSNMKCHLFNIYFLLTLGPPLPKALNYISIVEIQGDVFSFGGRKLGSSYNSAIYQLTCSSGICSWSTINQELKFGRESTVAIPVPDYFCEGKEGMLDH
jgi:hypothetical protein